MKITRPKNPARVISSARIIRAVASSTAIETGKPVQAIEARLKRRESKLTKLTLAV
jgi:hypothetical protein